MTETLTNIDVSEIELATDKVRVFRASVGREYLVSVADFSRILNPPPQVYAGTTYTLTRNDAGRHMRFTNGSPITVTIDNDQNVSILPDTSFIIEQAGAGTITFAAGSGVSLRFLSTLSAASAGQYAVVRARKLGPNEWLLFGMLAAA